MFRLLSLAPLILLAGCATPLQKCLNTANQDLRALDHLIATTQGNIDRGYAIETERVPTTYFDWCYFGHHHGHAYLCRQTSYDTRRKPVSIDIGQERRKLQDLKAARLQTAPRARRATAQCQAQYPNG